MLKAFDEMDEFERQMDKMLYAYFPSEHRTRPREWRPATDVYETDEAVIVKMEIAGMDAADFTISFTDHTLTVEGARLDRESKLGYHLLEIPYGEFRVPVYLPGTFAEDRIDARYENGFLYITLPKHREEHHVLIRTPSA
ncbi:MAG: Hsp20/alpha crystallin family protein [Chloroflexi bacterium]|nr:Hsp20/alpha crystallin family protein [Chloroflexota bacterium]